MFEKAKDVVVICPSSDILTLGIGSADSPKKFPHTIAYRRYQPAQEQIKLSEKHTQKQNVFIKKEYQEHEDYIKKEFQEQDNLLDVLTQEQDSLIKKEFQEQDNLKRQFQEQDNLKRQEAYGEIIRELKLLSGGYCSLGKRQSVDCESMEVESQVLLGDDVKNLKDEENYKCVWPLQKDGLCKERSRTQLRHDLSLIWSTAIQHACQIPPIEFQNYSVVLIVPEYLNLSDIELMMDTLLLDLEMKEVVIHASCTAALFGQGISSGCVVNLESDSIRVISVEDGVVIPGASTFLPFGGNQITEALAWILRQQGVTPMGSTWSPFQLEEMNQVRDGSCFFPIEGSEEALETHIKSESSVQLHCLDKQGRAILQEVGLGTAACVSPMGLFFPQLFGTIPQLSLNSSLSSSEEYYAGILDNQGTAVKTKPSRRSLVNEYELLGLDVGIVKSISSAEKVDQRRRLYTSILVVGPCSQLKGLSDMLERRVLSALPIDEVIDTVAVLETKFSSQDLIWKGGVVFGILTSSDQWIIQKEWKEGVNLEKPGKYGKTDILRSKVFWLLKTELGFD